MASKDKYTGDFIAFDTDSFEITFHENIFNAEICLKQSIDDTIECEGGITDAIIDGEYLVAKVLKRSKYSVIAEKKDYTDEEWEEEGYSLDSESIGSINLCHVDLEFVNQIKQDLIQNSNKENIEEAHINADDALCRLLEHLGYKEIVDLYHEVPKYYC